jgi:outer membrane receptor protein involved in Fe transport
MPRAAFIPRSLALLATLTSATSFAAAPPAVLEEVTVASTPLGGLELPIDRIPGNIQSSTSADIERAHQSSLAQFLDRRLGSVFINEAQNNPLQPDVQFRGFVASPLLGQPQGIAVYQDGVRINDPFGDIVNWALVPEAAVASVDLIPGSNPVFGLNALGGALSIHTKNGFTDPGTEAEVMGGSFGRVIATIESGGASNDAAGVGVVGASGLSYYASARYLSEDGWRNQSPSDAVHLFGDIGWRNDASSVDLSLTRVETDLVGNGPAPIQLLAIDRAAIYTHPDRTENSLTLLTLSAAHRLAPATQLQGVVYFRRSDIDSLNGDESDFAACDVDPALICDGDDEPALDADDDPIATADDIEGATLNRSSTRQETHGASLQLGITTPLARHENRLILGGSFDRSSVGFGSSTELGHFDDGRGAIAGGVLVGGAFVALDTRIENLSAFFTDTFAIAPKLDLTLSGRYNDTRVELRDQLGTALSGDHSFAHFNAAAGFTYRVGPSLRLYASYGESNRAPSPVELTCADEDDPCALPNAFLSDPPLQQVIAKTFEAGARGTWRDLRWHAGLFRTGNENDILFVSAGALTNRGFFDNVGDTRRQGIELNLSGKWLGGRLNWFSNYTRLQAEFQESFSVTSALNPAAVDGEIAVPAGARIPGTPEHMLAAGASLQLIPGLTVGVDMTYRSNQFLRGDEGNLNEPLSSYTVFNAGAEWQLNPSFKLFVQVENVFDEEYATFGLYGAADEVLGDEFDDPRFLSPAPPRSGWVGVRWML